MTLVRSRAAVDIGLMGARDTRPATFEEIDVQRINLREPDGTLRMVVSNRTRFPGGMVKGREYINRGRVNFCRNSTRPSSGVSNRRRVKVCSHRFNW